MELFDLINLKKLRKALLYLFCCLIALLLQTTVLSRGGPLGVKPFFLPALVVAIGMFEGGVWGAAFGIVIGIGCDISLSETTVLFLVLFAAIGFFSGLLTEFFINRRFVAWLMLSVLALLLTALCQIVPLWVFRGAAPGPLIVTGLLQSAWALPFAAAAYFAVKFIAGRERDRNA